MQKGIIDRFEGNFSLIELQNGQMTMILRQLLPKEARVGDSLIINDDYRILLDTNRTRQRRQEIDALANELFEE